MSKELGYQDNTAGPGKDKYNTTGGGTTGGKETNAHRKTKPGQGMKSAQSDNVNAGDHLSNNNAEVNGDPDE